MARRKAASKRKSKAHGLRKQPDRPNYRELAGHANCARKRKEPRHDDIPRTRTFVLSATTFAQNSTINRRRWYFGIDFGTTLSSLSYIILKPGEQETSVRDPRRITTINTYPFATQASATKGVPSESWYPDQMSSIPRSSKKVFHIDLQSSSEDDNDDEDMDEDTSLLRAHDDQQSHIENAFIWGYAVHLVPQRRIERRHDRHVVKPKLYLDNSHSSVETRRRLDYVAHLLIQDGMIAEAEHMIADYLTAFLDCGIRSIVDDNPMSQEDIVEFGFGEPAMWTRQASTISERAMEIAIHRNGLANLSSNGRISNFHLVSEPEAAAAYVLENDVSVDEGDVVTLADLGGGTADLITYEIISVGPVRCKQVIEADGGPFGASYLNEDVRELIRNRLKEEDYLWNTAGPAKLTLDMIVDELVAGFETGQKRTTDFDNKLCCEWYFFVPGLQKSVRKSLDSSCFVVSREESYSIFFKYMDGIARLVEKQLRKASDAGLAVNKVIVTGGFSENQALRKHLRDHLKVFGRELSLIYPTDSAASVSAGAVLLALDKDNRPIRMTRASYGLLTHFPYDPTNPGHLENESIRDEASGIDFARDTIDWIVRKGEIVAPHEVRKTRCLHEFKRDYRLVAGEWIYVSDDNPPSQYHNEHDVNRNAQILGKVEFDFTSLRDRGVIKPHRRSQKGSQSRAHWVIEFDLVWDIYERNLQIYAEYKGERLEGKRSKWEGSVASAFPRCEGDLR